MSIDPGPASLGSANLGSSGVGRALADQSDSRLRLQTIVRLRWFAVIGQTVAVAVVALWFRFPLPVGICLVFITCSAWLNVFLRVRFPARHRLGSALATGLLLYDIVQLAALLYLTGGVENPFIVLIVAPVTVSAATLPPRNTILLGAVAIAVTAALVQFSLPLPWDERFPLAGPLQVPLLYRLAILVAVVSCLTFLALYAGRLSKEGRQMAAALNASELVLAHEQKLHALDGLAAAAAHELGTPLATIVLVTKELEREFPAGSQHADDIALLRSQAQRCREILQKLTKSPSEQDPLHASLSVNQLLDEAAGPYRGSNIQIVIDAGPVAPQQDGSQSLAEPVGERRPGMIYGIGNIVENAVDFATAKVEIAARWSAREVVITVVDDGPGFSPEILDTIGEPYVTSRSAARSTQHHGQHAGKVDGAGGSGGLGLGFFIAKTLLERSGATLAFGNRGDGQQGAMVRIVWPRRSFETINAGGWSARSAVTAPPASGPAPERSDNALVSEASQSASRT